MKNFALSLLIVLFLTGCAQNRVIEGIYTNQEKNILTYCVGISDIGMNIATEKLKGTKKEAMIEFYRYNPQSKIALSAVEKVYSEYFTSAWDYNVKFYDECALNLAHIKRPKVDRASYCYQNQLIADTAYSFKQNNQEKIAAYQFFEKFGSKTPNQIIDKVYSSNGTRAEIKLGVWSSCIAQFVKI